MDCLNGNVRKEYERLNHNHNYLQFYTFIFMKMLLKLLEIYMRAELNKKPKRNTFRYNEIHHNYVK